MRRHAKVLVAALTLLVIVGVAQAIADTAPTPTMEPVSTFSYTSAHLKGKVNPNGGPSTTTWQFQYSDVGSDGPWTPGPEGHFEGTEAEENTPLSVEGDLSGLKPNTTYYTRLVATNEGGQSSVSAPSFATLEVAAPSVSIEAVSGPTSSSAQLVGHINPNAPEAAPTSPEVEAGFRVWWHFQCSPECPGLEGELEADEASHEVSAEATGLLPGTKYKVSLVAENAGTNSGAGPEEFTTEANAPLISPTSFSNVTSAGVTLKATINPGGASATYRFEYTDQADFEANGFTGSTKVPAPDAAIGSGTNDVAVSQAITGLESATKYVFRAVATNTVDSAESDSKSFTTFAASSEGPGGQFPGRGFLPDDRAWEMVSPPDKHGGNVGLATSKTQAAADGSAVAFTSNIGFKDVQGTNSAIEYMARRDGAAGTNGWGTHAITPRLKPATILNGFTSNFSWYVGNFSADLYHAVFQSTRPLTDAPKVEEVANLYLRDDLRSPGTGSYQLLTDAAAPLDLSGELGVPPASLPFVLPNLQPAMSGASADFSHVIFESRLGLTPGTSTSFSDHKLYENAEGNVRLVGRVPKEPDETSCDDASGPAVECVSAKSSQAGIGGGGATYYSARMISADGSRILFQTPAGFLYLREDGTKTFLLNASEKEPFDPPTGAAQLWDASRDGSRVFFTTGESLVEDDEDGGNSDLYMYEVEKPEGERLTLISDGAEEASGVRVIGVSNDGHYVYFVSDGQLVAGEPASVLGLYLWHDNDFSYIGKFADTNEANLNTPRTDWTAFTQAKTSRVTPDGRRLLFMTKSDEGFKGIGGFGGYDHGTDPCPGSTNGSAVGRCRELYTYDADSGQLRCASCNPSGATATVDALDDLHVDPGPIGISSHSSHALSDDGRYVFFSTAERLVSEDTNGTWDAYLYDTTTEEHHLLSSGQDKSPSYFLDASADGHDVFFATAEQLSGWDTDTSYDLYDARVGGGLPEPVPPPPACQGDACQPAPRQLNDPTPASSSFKGATNPSSGRCPKGKRKVKTRAGKSRCVKQRAKKKNKQKRAAKNNRKAGR